MFNNSSPVRWHNRLMDGLTAGLSAGGFIMAASFAFGMPVALGALAVAGLYAMACTAHEDRHTPKSASSPRGRLICETLAKRAGVQVSSYREDDLGSYIGLNSNGEINICQDLASTATTPQLASVIGHEVGHTHYGFGVMNFHSVMTMLGYVAMIGSLAAPVIGLAGLGASLLATTGACASSFLLRQMHARQTEYACDRMAVKLAGLRANLESEKMRLENGSEQENFRPLQNSFKPGSIGEQLVNLLDDHPPVHSRISAAQAFARHLPAEHDAQVTRDLLAGFSQLSAHKPAPTPLRHIYAHQLA